MSDAKKLIRQPLQLIEIVLLKHQEAILEVCKEQQEKIERLEAENKRLRDCIVSLTEQNAALIWERDGHGKSNVPDIFVQNAALTGENMILISECQQYRAALEKLIGMHGVEEALSTTKE